MSGLHRSSSALSNDGLPSQELLDDLCSRFVLNVPKEDLQSFERILFLVEYAHWYYEDNSVERNPSLKSLSLKEFTCLRILRRIVIVLSFICCSFIAWFVMECVFIFTIISVMLNVLVFNSCEILRPYVAHIDDIFKDFTSYKVRVPVTGAIILDDSYERCLLVKGWKGSSWSFPRGKKNKDEEDHACAIREVFEETGFDVSNLLNKDEFIEMIFGQQRVRLYVIAGVKEDTSFTPQTKKEISEIAWHRLDELQPVSDAVISRSMTGLKLYMVAPFLPSLRSWILAHQPPLAPETQVPIKGMSVWKAKNSSISSGSTFVVAESQPSRSSTDSHTPNPSPGKSFRNFRFDTTAILRAMETAFSV